ncbi:hypothetical protein BDW60DRAFT_184695 [Aspergillus nidulans var. acristatus]
MCQPHDPAIFFIISSAESRLWFYSMAPWPLEFDVSVMNSIFTFPVTLPCSSSAAIRFGLHRSFNTAIFSKWSFTFDPPRSTQPCRSCLRPILYSFTTSTTFNTLPTRTS